MGNSLAVAVGTGLLTAVIATMAGYGFARFRFRGSGVVFALVLVTMMIPFQALLTPLFLEMHSLGLTNSLAGLALFYTTFNLPFGVFVMRNTFLQIPWELSEAAAVDGASPARTLMSVLRPLVVPGVATTVLYAFLFSWTEFVGALTFITSNNLYTLPLALLNMEYGSVGQVNFGYLEAGAVIAMVPVRAAVHRPAALLHPRPGLRRRQGVSGIEAHRRARCAVISSLPLSVQTPMARTMQAEHLGGERGGRGAEALTEQEGAEQDRGDRVADGEAGLRGGERARRHRVRREQHRRRAGHGQHVGRPGGEDGGGAAGQVGAQFLDHGGDEAPGDAGGDAEAGGAARRRPGARRRDGDRHGRAAASPASHQASAVGVLVPAAARPARRKTLMPADIAMAAPHSRQRARCPPARSTR